MGRVRGQECRAQESGVEEGGGGRTRGAGVLEITPFIVYRPIWGPVPGSIEKWLWAAHSLALSFHPARGETGTQYF